MKVELQKSYGQLRRIMSFFRIEGVRRPLAVLQVCTLLQKAKIQNFQLSTSNFPFPWLKPQTRTTTFAAHPYVNH